MSNTADILERFYDSFINQEQDWDFFVGLEDYLDYVLKIPILSDFVFRVMKKKDEEYKKLEDLENKSVKELEGAKVQLLKIIKDYKVNPDAIKRTFSFSSNINALEELELFEKRGKSEKSIFDSGNLFGLLFDIARGISEQGHKDKLKKFIVSDSEFSAHHSNPNSNLVLTGNRYGNFIFSKTLRLRRQQKEHIKNAKKSELWSVFDELLKFHKAFTERSKNRHSFKILNEDGRTAKTYKEVQDTVDIAFMVDDLDKMVGMGSNSILSGEIYHLKRDEFKNRATRANTYLLNELAKIENEKGDTQKVKQRIVIDFQKGIYNAKHKNLVYEISGKRLKIVEYLCKNNTASLSNLITLTGQANPLIVKEINEVNKNFRGCLKVKKDLIVHSKTGGGYRLNKDDLDIKTSA